MINNNIKFKINTLNQEQLFNKFNQENITLINIVRDNKFDTSFFVCKKDFKVTKKILNSNNISYTYCYTGLTKLWQFLFFRYFVIIAIFLSCIMIYCSSFFILRLDVNCTNLELKQQVEKYLYSQNNIKSITSKNLIKNDEIEIQLLENFEKISMVNVITKGLTLVVNIKEKPIEDSISKNLKANFSGRILSITTISGESNVKKGDIVKNGDILVKSIKNQKANAKIIAEVWLEYTNIHYSKQLNLIRTGKFVTNKIICCGKIPIFNKGQIIIPYKKYDIEKTNTKLNNVLLPLIIEEQKIYEVEEKEIISNYIEEKDNILSMCKKNTLQQMLDNDIIISENVSIVNYGEITYTTYIMVVERNIF